MTWSKPALRTVSLTGILCCGLLAPALAQAPQPTSVAFVNVNVVPLDSERVERRQTVLVLGDRIVAVGSTDSVVVPSGATVIDGAGQYLTPGLTDAHVHLPTGVRWAPTRDDFGDAPMYLAHRVTTVVNMGGTPTQLDWRKRIEDGRLLGPTIYTAGPFVNEPRVSSSDEVGRDIRAQAQRGYDLVKFHECRMDDGGSGERPESQCFGRTTTGLSSSAYRRMVETARQLRIPLIGHAPRNLGLDEMLQGRQSLAHSGELSNMYFLPSPTLLLGAREMAPASTA